MRREMGRSRIFLDSLAVTPVIVRAAAGFLHELSVKLRIGSRQALASYVKMNALRLPKPNREAIKALAAKLPNESEEPVLKSGVGLFSRQRPGGKAKRIISIRLLVSVVGECRQPGEPEPFLSSIPASFQDLGGRSGVPGTLCPANFCCRFATPSKIPPREEFCPTPNCIPGKWTFRLAGTSRRVWRGKWSAVASGARHRFCAVGKLYGGVRFWRTRKAPSSLRFAGALHSGIARESRCQAGQSSGITGW